MRRMLFSFFLFFFSSHYAGFSPNTVVLSPQGFISIGQLQKNSCVTSYDFTTNNYLQGIVSNHCAYTSSLAYRVVCDNDISFVASPDQIVMANKQWHVVKDLKKGDRLKCCDVSRRSEQTKTDNAYATVLSVEVCNNENLLCEITVEPFHTFCVTPRGIIAHNHPIAIFAVAPPVMSALSKVAIVGVISGALWNLFSKKKNRGKNHFIQQASSSGGSSPSPKKPNDEDEFRKKHPHGRYEDVGYHHKNSSGAKSPAPIDGQKALNNSLRIKDTKPHRIGISQDQFVVLRETSPGLFHGYVCEWEQLTDTMQKVLRKAQWASHNGKIICK